MFSLYPIVALSSFLNIVTCGEADKSLTNTASKNSLKGRMDQARIIFQSNPEILIETTGKPSSFSPLNDDVCRGRGQYLNICGECVGGSSEKDDSYGMDSCGVCRGFDRCLTPECFDESEEDNELFEETSNCSGGVLRLSPAVLDMAASKRASVNITGDGLTVNDTECALMNDPRRIDVHEYSNGLALGFDFNGKEEILEMLCNTTGGRHLRVTLFIVNSNRLLPLSSDKFSVPYSGKNKLTLKVSNMFALVDLMCFAKLNGTIIYKYWTNDIQGNSLMSQVTCDELWLESTSQFQLGVAYSAQSLEKAKTIDISVEVDPLIVEDVRWHADDVVTIQFNQNVGEAVGCEKIMKEKSLNRFSYCETTANRMRLNCKKNECHTNQSIEFMARVDSSTVKQSFALKIPAPQSTSAGKLRIEGPSVTCSGDVVTFSIFDDDELGATGKIQWSLSPAREQSRNEANASDVKFEATNGGGVTTGNQQRRNLILWQGLRELRRVQKASQQQRENIIVLNSSLLLPNVPYQLTALFNTSTMKVNLTKTFIVLTTNSTPTVEIFGPSEVAYGQTAFFEANVTSCSPVSNLELAWKLGNNETLKMLNGTKAFISAGQLARGMNKVSLIAILNGSELSQGYFQTKSMEATFRQVLLEEITIGTGQSFSFEDPSDEPSQIYSNVTLSCSSNTGRCLKPTKSQNALEFGVNDDNSFLHIARGSLAVGMYKFTLTWRLPSGNSKWNDIQVNIVPGEPPQLKLASYSLNPDLNVLVDVMDVLSDCEIQTKCLKRTNSSFYDIRKKLPALKLTGTPSHPESTRIKINIPTNRIKHGTNYTFQVVASCGSGMQSWLTFSVPVPEKSVYCQLKVTPKFGDALKTKFKFSLRNCTSRDAVISYGYLLNDSNIFLTTSLERQVELFGFPGNPRPVAKLCEPDKSCTFTYGDQLAVESKSVENIEEVIKSYKNNLNSLLYEDASGIVQLTSHSFGNQQTKPVNDIIQILKERINEVTKLLIRNSSATDLSLDLLQFATNVSRLTGATNEILPKIVEFRDKIQLRMNEKSASLKMKREPVTLKGNTLSIVKDPRPRRSPGLAGGESQLAPSTIKTMLTTFAYVILHHNDPKKVREEKEKFLNRIPGYIEDMCNSVGRADGVLAGSTIAQLSAVRTGQSKLRQEISVPLCSTKCSNATGQLSVGRQVLKNNEGVCIGSSYMPYDFYSDTKNDMFNQHLMRQSGVYAAKVFNFVGNEVNDEVVLKKPSIVIKIPLWMDVTFSSDSSKCFAWIEDRGWSSDVCKTAKPTISNGIQFVECRCPVPGIFSIFSSGEIEDESFNATFNEDKERLSETTSSPEFSKEHPKVTATFMINEDFNETVGNKQDEFDESLKTQLMEKVNLPEQVKVETDNYRDNVKVLLKLKFWDQSNLPTVVLDLADILDKGDLKLLGLDQKELNVPRQKLELTLVNRKRPSSLIATISSIIFLGLTIVVVMIFASMLVKWRRRQRALNFLQVAASSDPKYLKLHDSASIERIIRQSSGEHSHSNEGGDGILLSVYQQRNNTAIQE